MKRSTILISSAITLIVFVTNNPIMANSVATKVTKAVDTPFTPQPPAPDRLATGVKFQIAPIKTDDTESKPGYLKNSYHCKAAIRR